MGSELRGDGSSFLVFGTPLPERGRTPPTGSPRRGQRERCGRGLRDLDRVPRVSGIDAETRQANERVLAPEGLRPTKRVLLLYALEHGYVTNRLARGLTGLGLSAMRNALARLAKAGWLVATGSGPGRFYEPGPRLEPLA